MIDPTSYSPSAVDDDVHATVHSLLSDAFPPSATAAWRVDRIDQVGIGRGVFSLVLAVELTWTTGSGPSSVVIKIPAAGPNGEAAIASGACRREAIAYRQVLPHSPVRHPTCFLVHRDGEAASFVLEDLCRYRSVDQLEGLDQSDATALVEALARFHAHWADEPSLPELDVRRSTPSTLGDEVVHRGLEALSSRWSHAVGPDVQRAFEGLVADRSRLVDAFTAAARPTLCHGDPRADNVAFDPAGKPVLYDWQQLAVQFGPADLAWLAATSLDTAVRRSVERELIDAYGTTIDRYRLGLLLPGLAVLVLAQREAGTDRAARLIATSIVRIGTAIADLDVASAGR